MFAKDKPHMSGYLVIAFYVLIGVDIVIGINWIKETGENWLNCVLGINMFFSAIGLIILLNARKAGGIITLVTSVILAACSFIPDTVVTDDGIGFWFGIIHIIPVLMVLFGSGRYFLIPPPQRRRKKR